MLDFIQRHAGSVIGVLSGFDRVLFRGTLRRIANAAGMSTFLSYTGVLAIYGGLEPGKSIVALNLASNARVGRGRVAAGRRRRRAARWS